MPQADLRRPLARLRVCVRASRYWRGLTMPERVALRYAHDTDAWAERLVEAMTRLERAAEIAVAAAETCRGAVAESDAA